MLYTFTCTFATVTCLSDIRDATEKDNILQNLIQFVLLSWPDKKCEVPDHIVPFLTSMMRSEKLMESYWKALGLSYLKHCTKRFYDIGHLGSVNYQLAARGSLYWPQINKDIELMVKQCSPCQLMQKNQWKEHLKWHRIPPFIWHTLGLDVFFFKQDFSLCCRLLQQNSNYLWSAQPNCPGTDTSFYWTYKGICFSKRIVSDASSNFVSSDFMSFAVCFTFRQWPHHLIIMQLKGKLNEAFRPSKTFLKSSQWRILVFSCLVITTHMTSCPKSAISSWIVR